MNTMNVMSPFSFKDWLDKQRPSLASGRPIDMFGAQFETEVPGIVLSDVFSQRFYGFKPRHMQMVLAVLGIIVLCCYNTIMLHLMIMTGNGVWTWADRDACTAK